MQATTLDGSAEHQKVKQDLHSKLGIPDNLQRLFFQIPSSSEIEAEDAATQTQELIEDLSSGLQDWQASTSAQLLSGLLELALVNVLRPSAYCRQFFPRKAGH